MKSPSKPQRKKQPEPLDWRELAGGSALRGLSDVLANPPTVVDFTTEGFIPTARVTPSEDVIVKQVDTPTVVYSPTEAVIPTEILSPSVDIWEDSEGNLYENRRVYAVTNAHQTMSLGEERVYRTLWTASEADGVVQQDESVKIFTLGYDRLANLVRLNEKSVRLLIPKMIAKQMLEIIAPERSADRTGRTYRIFSGNQIMERQRAIGLMHIAKRGRAVELVRRVTDLR